ncbi:hypothetical protein C8Q69DRAFT_441659 [Paecilomyces variotii]|uniref:Uncharacterized protein n=1 Tax=Byssochlamys spectabilis TaxID=264951 RepID=A0A443I079_BYSSP|nr:hypothetical protein C8Q69DRAFT_441659 [Paecilomyces variotii]RWQ97464.1 hypothetical protein C8Q69DRAFT_441659 [Paecilomyces variotii]
MIGSKHSRPQRQKRATKQGRNVATNRWGDPSAAPEHFSSREGAVEDARDGRRSAILLSRQRERLTSSRSWPALTGEVRAWFRREGWNGTDGNPMEEKPSDWENQREKEESSRERRENKREGEEGPGRVVVMVVVVVVMLDRARAGTMIQGPESERGLSETTVGDEREARGRKRRGRRGKKKRDRGGQDKTGQRQKKGLGRVESRTFRRSKSVN